MNMIDQASLIELQMLLTRIAIEGYTTIEQIRGDITNRMEELKGETMTAEQYHNEASADHFTENQF